MHKPDIANNDTLGEIFAVLDEIVHVSTNVEKIEATILTIKFMEQIVWKNRKQVFISIRYPWSSAFVREVLCAGRVRGKQRLDGILYKARNGGDKTGLVQCILQHRQHKCAIYFLVRQLCEAQVQQGNINVVEEFGHMRFKYNLNDEDGNMDVVDVEEVVCPVMIVHDPFDMVKNMGKKCD